MMSVPTPESAADRGPRRRFRCRRILALAVAAAALAWCAASWWASSHFLHPARGPFRLPGGAPPFEVFTVETEDGVRLAAASLEAASGRPAGTVLLFHGLGGQRQTWRMRALRDAGFRSLAVDFRAHGESGGDMTSFGWHERRDVRALVRHARERHPDAPLAAWGTSLGGAALCFAADDVRDLSAVVLESVYSTMESAYEHRLGIFLPRALFWTAAGFRACAEWQLGLECGDLRPVDHVGRLRSDRTLIVTGALDDRATPEDARLLASRAGDAGLHLVPGAGHDDVWTAGGADYREAVIAFLRRRCGG